VDGLNLRIDRRWGAGNPGRVETLAKELVGLQPEVIVGYSTPAVLALRKETSTIPIVFVQVSDPIGTGFITNLAHPGGNITGFTNFESSMVGKWAEMLKEIAPRISRVAFLFKRPPTSPDITRDHWRPLCGLSGCNHGQIQFTTPARSKAQ
jgi:putative tryptophan/tyrosine transport system substrate-binding protein